MGRVTEIYPVWRVISPALPIVVLQMPVVPDRIEPLHSGQSGQTKLGIGISQYATAYCC